MDLGSVSPRFCRKHTCLTFLVHQISGVEMLIHSHLQIEMPLAKSLNCWTSWDQSVEFRKFPWFYPLELVVRYHSSPFSGTTVGFQSPGGLPVARGTPITVNFPDSNAFSMQSNLHEVYDYLNSTHLVNKAWSRWDKSNRNGG